MRVSVAHVAKFILGQHVMFPETGTFPIDIDTFVALLLLHYIYKLAGR
jgi:hypothetical protein